MVVVKQEAKPQPVYTQFAPENSFRENSLPVFLKGKIRSRENSLPGQFAPAGIISFRRRESSLPGKFAPAAVLDLEGGKFAPAVFITLEWGKTRSRYLINLRRRENLFLSHLYL